MPQTENELHHDLQPTYDTDTDQDVLPAPSMSGSAMVTFNVATRADDLLLHDCDCVRGHSPIDALGAMLGAEHKARPLVWHRALPARSVLAAGAHDRSTDLGLAADRLARPGRRLCIV
jgi:hypothetical protein